MRRLVLFRHAKAVAGDDGDDHGRALSQRGEEDAPRMGRYLAGAGFRPSLALVSDARRTHATFELAASAFDAPIPLQLDAGIYEGSESWAQLLALVRNTGDDVTTLLVIGHNPAIGDLAAQLCGSGDRRARAELRCRFPTSAVAILEFGVARWPDISVYTGCLDRFVTPACLGGVDD